MNGELILECFEYNQHFVAMMNIINNAKRCNVEGKFEKHHIIPRCFYKNKELEVDNSSSNLVNLTLEEHRKVHKLAYLCAKDIVKISLDYARRLMNRESLCGLKHSEEHKRKISETQKGKHHKHHKPHGPMSDEHKKKMSEAMKSKTRCEETRKKMSEAKKGKPHGPMSDEHKKKMSEVHKGKPSNMKGKKHSEESKKKMSSAKKGKHWKLIDGIRVWH